MRYLLSSLLLILTVSAHAQDESVSQKYAVYSAALDLMRFPKPNAYVVVNDTTLNWHCGEASGNTVQINGCGIWIPTQTPASIEAELRKDWPTFDATTWPNFVTGTDKSVKLKDDFKTSWKHELINLNTANSAKHVDGVVLVSAVGFNERGDEAIVYILFLSYMEQVPTSGNLFLMRKDKSNHWIPSGRETLMQMQK